MSAGLGRESVWYSSPIRERYSSRRIAGLNRKSSFRRASWVHETTTVPYPCTSNPAELWREVIYLDRGSGSRSSVEWRSTWDSPMTSEFMIVSMLRKHIIRFGSVLLLMLAVLVWMS